MKQDRPSRVVLVGFMGAGKTTVGKLLAERLQRRFVDLDDLIRQREGREIADIFRESGEEHFRQVESECLRELVSESGPLKVIAVGGGAFVHAGNAALLREHGYKSVFLDAGVEALRARCAAEGNRRPLFRDENQFRQLYEARRSSYMAADLRIDTEGRTPEQIVEKILAVRD